MGVFVRDEPALGSRAAPGRIWSERATRGDDAVAGYDDGKRVARAQLADRPWAGCQGLCKVSVAGRLAIADRNQPGTQYLAALGGTGREREIELLAITGEPGFQLIGGGAHCIGRAP